MKKALISVLVSSYFIFSCEKNEREFDKGNSKIDVEVLIPNTAKVIQNSKERLSYLDGQADYEEFAKMLAATLKDKEVRKFLKDEANKKFDGDFDILFSKIAKNEISGFSMESKMKSNEKKGSSSFLSATKNVKLNISIPVLIEKWDDKKQIPLVAVAVNAEEDTKYIKAFDHTGKVYLIDNINEPNLPVIVIGENERMDFESNNLINYPNTMTKGARIQNINCVSPFRINGKNERWKGMKLSSSGLSNIEVWSKGAPEILVDIFAPTSGGWNSVLKIGGSGGSKYEPTNRNDIKDKWWYGNGGNLDVAMFNWNTATIAKTVKFYFWERDEQTNVSKTISLSGSYKIPATQGFPETTVTINQTASYPGDSDTIFEQLIYQDDCPPYFEGTPLYAAWGGTNVKVAMLSF